MAFVPEGPCWPKRGRARFLARRIGDPNLVRPSRSICVVLLKRGQVVRVSALTESTSPVPFGSRPEDALMEY
jgi:hypothetical protein